MDNIDRCDKLITKNTLIINLTDNLNISLCYIYKSDCQGLQFHFFPTSANCTFVTSCEFNGLVSKSCRIPPAALFIYFKPHNPEEAIHVLMISTTDLI